MTPCPTHRRSRTTAARLGRAIAAFGALAVVAAGACAHYEPPPTPLLEGLTDGTLPNAKAPLVVDFGKPVRPETLKLTIAYYETDLEGNLPDEDDDPDTELRILLTNDADKGARGGSVALDGDGSRAIVTPDGALPVGPKLVLLVEPGLEATDGRVRTNRTRIPFAFTISCNAGATANKLTSGVYFLLLEVEQPLGTQIQLYGAIDVDPATGAFRGQFTNADRNPDNARCPTPCSAVDACRLLPSPACVAPSTRAGTVDEYPDFVPNPTPPTGYSFAVQGCAADDPNGAGLVTAPATMVVESPPVTVAGLTMTAFFAPSPDGVLRATGTLTADVVSLGGNPIGPGKGTMTAVRMPDDEVPPGVPPAPAKAADAGAGGGDAGP